MTILFIWHSFTFNFWLSINCNCYFLPLNNWFNA